MRRASSIKNLGFIRSPMAAVATMLISPVALPAMAQEALPTIDVVAERPGEGPTSAASERNLDGQEVNQRIFARPAEALEAAPGLIITQHSGEGKANQYFLRGFNLDHGTDLAINFDGMPINMRTHGHGQGYADFNFLIPELIGNMNVRKGPYFANQFC